MSEREELIKIVESLKEGDSPLVKFLPSRTHPLPTECGTLHLHVTYSDETLSKVVKVSADLGKSGTCARSHLSSTCEALTGMFRYLPHNVRTKIMIMMAGHKCVGGGKTCTDAMLRRLMAIDPERSQDGK